MQPVLKSSAGKVFLPEPRKMQSPYSSNIKGDLLKAIAENSFFIFGTGAPEKKPPEHRTLRYAISVLLYLIDAAHEEKENINLFYFKTLHVP